MGAALYITDQDGRNDVVIVAGANELDELWTPIIERHNLSYLEHAFGGGLSVTSENYLDLQTELSTLLNEVEKRVAFENDFVNPVFRIRRLQQHLTNYPPQSGTELYLG